MQKAQAWAQRTFGDAQLGDARRTARLVEVAGGICARPAGRVTQVFQGVAQREGAFRLIENAAVEASQIAQASHRATARQCAKHALVYVPVDQTSLSLVDRAGTKFGPTGSHNEVHRGMFAMSALAVAQDGTTLGTTALQYWVRKDERCPKWKKDRRAAHERESDLWQRAIGSTVEVMSEHAPQCVPWFQMDRGADFGQVLALGHRQQLRMTVRAVHDRAIETQKKGYLWGRMRGQPVLGHITVNVPAGKHRPARVARLSVRAKYLRLRVAKATKQRRTEWIELCAVYVSECGRHQDAIEWMLWTTHPVQTLADVLQVVRGYTMRWRIEDFHRAWKSGACNIESSQLRSVDAVQRWGAMTAAVAARAENLKLLARTDPDRPADTELSREELDAAIVLSETKKHRVGETLTIHQAVDLIARVGGYIGKSSGGPPGTATITRGLTEVVSAARVLRATAKRSG